MSQTRVSLIIIRKTGLCEDPFVCMRCNNTCEHRRMGTVEDDELRHHLWVVNGKQPCYSSTPVVSNETTSVVSLKEKGASVRRCIDIVMSIPIEDRCSGCCLLEHVSVWKSILFSRLYCCLPPSEDICIKCMYFMTHSQMQIKVRTSVWRDSDHVTVSGPTKSSRPIYTHYYESC